MKFVPASKNARITKITKDVLSCKKCKEIATTRKNSVPGYGFTNADIFFLGLAPGRLGADVTGIPFTKDSSGKLFQLALSSSGISMEPNGLVQEENTIKAYVTNLVKCNPKDSKGNNRYPSHTEIENCKYYLNMEMDSIHFDVIVPLGKLATENLLNQKCSKFSSIHNKPIKLNEFYCIPFIHPSYVARGAYPKDKYIDDFRSLARWVREYKNNHDIC
jgi:uracil-DNA glycosylase family 4